MRPRYRSHLMRRLVEDMEGLEDIFAELVEIANASPSQIERPHRDAPRRRD